MVVGLVYLTFLNVEFFLFFLAFHFIFLFLVIYIYIYIYFSKKKKGSLHSGRSKVTRVTVGRDTDQPKFSIL